MKSLQNYLLFLTIFAILNSSIASEKAISKEAESLETIFNINCMSKSLLEIRRCNNSPIITNEQEIIIINSCQSKKNPRSRTNSESENNVSRKHSYTDELDKKLFQELENNVYERNCILPAEELLLERKYVAQKRSPKVKSITPKNENIV